MKLSNHKMLMTHKASSAFSLIELLVVISIIGIMAGIAITYVVISRDEAKKSRDRRNAQQVSQAAAIMQIHGKSFLSSQSLEEIVQALSDESGNAVNNSGLTFKLNNLSSSDIDGLANYISWPNTLGVPVYDPKID
jgi:prepilin-type N-terminal cleavage/methylation domain-containing protein